MRYCNLGNRRAFRPRGHIEAKARLRGEGQRMAPPGVGVKTQALLKPGVLSRLAAPSVRRWVLICHPLSLPGHSGALSSLPTDFPFRSVTLRQNAPAGNARPITCGYVSGDRLTYEGTGGCPAR